LVFGGRRKKPQNGPRKKNSEMGTRIWVTEKGRVGVGGRTKWGKKKDSGVSANWLAGWTKRGHGRVYEFWGRKFEERGSVNIWLIRKRVEDPEKETSVEWGKNGLDGKG